jgi:hypothetical protein
MNEEFGLERNKWPNLCLRGAFETVTQPVDGLEYEMELIAGGAVRRIADCIFPDPNKTVEASLWVEVREALWRETGTELRQAVGEHDG